MLDTDVTRTDAASGGTTNKSYRKQVRLVLVTKTCLSACVCGYACVVRARLTSRSPHSPPDCVAPCLLSSFDFAMDAIECKSSSALLALKSCWAKPLFQPQIVVRQPSLPDSDASVAAKTCRAMRSPSSTFRQSQKNRRRRVAVLHRVERPQ